MPSAKRPQLGDAVLVSWRDACSAGGAWQGQDELDNAPTAVTTVGILVADEPSHVTVALSLDVAKHRNGWILIPAVNVQRFELLRPSVV